MQTYKRISTHLNKRSAEQLNFLTEKYQENISSLINRLINEEYTRANSVAEKH